MRPTLTNRGYYYGWQDAKKLESWAQGFGALRSVLKSWTWTPDSRMKLKTLIVDACAQDRKRYEREWLPYIQENAWCSPVERSIRLELDIPRMRGGLPLAYLRPTHIPEEMDPRTYPWQLYTEYGLSVPRGIQNPQRPLDDMSFPKATHRLMNWLCVNQAYPTRSTPEKTAQARIFLRSFLESFDEDTVCLNSGAGIVLPQATFCHSVTLVGKELSGFMILWDED